MSDDIWHFREHHPVGQGLFHSARLEVPGVAPFNYVYDCGALGSGRRINEEVDHLIAELNSRSEMLDAVFISHFHADHFNGLKRLLHPTNGVRAARIYLPFLDDLERVIALAASPASSSSRFTLNSSGDVDLRSVLDVGDAEVVEVLPAAGPSDPGVTLADEPPPDRGDDLGGIETVLPTLGEGMEWSPSLTGGEGPRFEIGVTRGSSSGAHSAAGPGSGVIYDDQSIVLAVDGHAVWELRTHVESTVRALAPMFLAVLAADSRIHAVLAPGQTVERWLEVAANRVLLLTDPRLRPAARAAYVAAVSVPGVNLTSLSLYSGPSRDPSSVVSWDGPRFPRGRLTSGLPLQEGVSWLGTGDGRFVDADLVDRFSAHFEQSRLDRVRTLVIPHHGSAEDLSDGFVAKFRRPDAVFSYGEPNKHKHPRAEALAVVERARMRRINVTNKTRPWTEEFRLSF